ncbi:MAG: endolytic transglycosylase MltG [Bacteroidales bacterium]|nr:endolytic transglycosylase MltG [Bacteroidales bacterium]
MKRKRTKLLLWITVTIASIVILAVALAGYIFYKTLFGNNVALPANQSGYLYVKTGSAYNDLLLNVENSGLLINISTFKWLANRKNLHRHVYPGRYEFKPGMSNDEIINMLRSGKQKPLNVIFNNITFPAQLAGAVSKQLEADSASIMKLFNDEKYLTKFGLTIVSAPAIFIPNTYEFYWNTSAEGFFDRMYNEYNKFWTTERKLKAELHDLTQKDVSIIASIVEKETNKNDEKARIAGVYLNRLRRGWKLQADPTTVYAVYLQTGVALNRVLRVHTQIDSPYNTYIHVGLPPGPICMPSISSIDAVLNTEKHNYMFFVASPDMSGYHRFSTNYNQHLIYAREYQAVLNQMNR